jgi:hypothetical protein
MTWKNYEMDLKDLTLSDDLRIFTLNYEDHTVVASLVAGSYDCVHPGFFEFDETCLVIRSCVL